MFVLLKLWVGTLGSQFLDIFKTTYNMIPALARRMAYADTVWYFLTILRNVIIKLLLYLAPFLLVALIVGLTTEIVQVKWKPTAKPLQPKLSKFNPINGFKKIVSLQSLAELLKSILKILIIGYIAYSTLHDKWSTILILLDIPLMQSIGTVGNIVINLGIKIAAFYLIIAFADYAFQRWKFREDMKMTKQEVKDEYKNTEGDPQIKGRQKQKMMESSRRRMMQNVPQADVVITNPTHIAVAILYDNTKDEAPRVIAKGEDYLALKIKETAKDSGVPIVENKPLARALYATVEIDEIIPPELYQAVAEILAVVYTQKNKAVS